MIQTFFTIESRTNLHVGSGKANYGVIDNLVQRDPTFQYPVIHASSLKGGIKEHCHGMNSASLNIKTVFGSEKVNGKSKHDDSQTGAYKFFDAQLLSMPVRCDKRAFIHITCPNILEDLYGALPDSDPIKNQLNAIKSIISDNCASNAVKGYCFHPELNGATIEDFDITATFDDTIARLFGNSLIRIFKYDVVLLQNRIFNRLTNDLHLPVIARNYLENGESKNLWYEQVVPRLSRFWSRCLHPEGDMLFKDVLFEHTALVQLGANGSVGYGYCSFSKI